MYTCERTGVNIAYDPQIVWSFLSNEMITRLRTTTPVSTLNESMSVSTSAEGFSLMGNISSSGTVVTVLQVNASSSFNGAMVECSIYGNSNTLTFSIKGE